MKVWEYINKLKNTTATREEIHSWAYVNNIIPCELSENLDLKENDFKDFESNTIKITVDICKKANECIECLDYFLESEIEE